MRRIACFATAAVVGLSACGGDSPTSSAGTLPDADHVHSLQAADDGALLLGLHGALWRSPDQGLSWDLIGLEGQDAMAIGVAIDGEPLIVGGHNVLERSTDGGTTFESLRPATLPGLDIHALAQAPSDPSIVYAFVVGAGLFRSEDAGDTWAPRAGAGEALPQDVAAAVVMPADPDVVLLGSGSLGVFRSEDGGGTFEQVSDWGTLGLAAVGDPVELMATTYRGVDVSVDGGGRIWENLAESSTFDGQPIATTIDGEGTFWVITEKPRVLWRSDDRGESWLEVARA